MDYGSVRSLRDDSQSVVQANEHNNNSNSNNNDADTSDGTDDNSNL